MESYEKFRKAHEYASLLTLALGRYAYLMTSDMMYRGHHTVYSKGQWIGQVPSSTANSRAPHVAYAKTGELVLAGGGRDGDLIMGPIAGNELSLGWMGGVAKDGIVVAVSKWQQQHDKLLALLVLYAMFEKCRLHHIGYRFADEESFIIKAAGMLGGMERTRPDDDHRRIYFRRQALELPYYEELQFFPDGPHDSAAHWDIVTEEPGLLLRFVANAFGQEPIFWEAGENDPIGAFWAVGDDGSKMGVMARSKWWNV